MNNALLKTSFESFTTLEINDDAMLLPNDPHLQKSYCVGDIATVDATSTRLEHGRKYVFTIPQGGLLIRQYEESKKGNFFIALNPKFPAIKADDTLHIVGLVTGRMRPE